MIKHIDNFNKKEKKEKENDNDFKRIQHTWKNLTKNSNFSKIIIKENRILVGQNAKCIKILMEEGKISDGIYKKRLFGTHWQAENVGWWFHEQDIFDDVTDEEIENFRKEMFVVS